MTTKKIVLIIAGVVGVLATLVFVFVIGVVGLVLYQVGNSEAAEKAREFLRASEKLKADIGEVQDFGSIATGSISMQSGNGEATMNLKVIGERKTVNASVHLVLVRGSDWRVSSASYVNDSGQTVHLLDPYDTKIPPPKLQRNLRGRSLFLCDFAVGGKLTTETRRHREGLMLGS